MEGAPTKMSTNTTMLTAYFSRAAVRELSMSDETEPRRSAAIPAMTSVMDTDDVIQVALVSDDASQSTEMMQCRMSACVANSSVSFCRLTKHIVDIELTMDLLTAVRGIYQLDLVP